MKLHLDFETCSAVDLTEVGLMNYVTHPSTRVLLAAWSLSGINPAHEPYVMQDSYEDGFLRLHQHVMQADEVHAWNAPFEWAVMRHVLGWPIDLRKMRCTMAHALYRAFPAKLDACAKVFGMSGKPADATRLLSLWSMGRGKAKPGDWDRFCAYNINDVVMELGIARRLAPYPWPKAELHLWQLGEVINWRGAPVDLEACEAAVAMHDRITAEALGQIALLTGVTNPNSTAQLAKYLGVKSLAKDNMPEMKAKARGDRLRVLELREQVALSAPKKYTVALRQANGGRLRNMLQYSGAGRTHRWSGRALQPQNLRRGWKDDDRIEQAWSAITGASKCGEGDWFSTLADLVRSIIKPEKGQLAVADFSSIEVVMLHWAAGDKDMLADLHAGLDAYKRFAAGHFGVPIEKVTKDQRTFAKPVVLGAGYGLGPTTLVEYAAGMGVTMDEVTAIDAVQRYRRTNTAVTDLWSGLETAMRSAIVQPGREYRYGHFRFRMVEGACLCRLPSGAEITYWAARIVPDERGGSLEYEGVNQVTGHWSTIRTWGARLVENVVQSISRDVLAYALHQALQAGLDVVLHVHDEVVVQTGEEDPEAVLAALMACMTAPPWCSDAPVKAAGFLCPRYRKD